MKGEGEAEAEAEAEAEGKGKGQGQGQTASRSAPCGFRSWLVDDARVYEANFERCCRPVELRRVHCNILIALQEGVLSACVTEPSPPQPSNTALREPSPPTALSSLPAPQPTSVEVGGIMLWQLCPAAELK